jgi:hypothetical protein
MNGKSIWMLNVEKAIERLYQESDWLNPPDFDKPIAHGNPEAEKPEVKPECSCKCSWCADPNVTSHCMNCDAVKPTPTGIFGQGEGSVDRAIDNATGKPTLTEQTPREWLAARREEVPDWLSDVVMRQVEKYREDERSLRELAQDICMLVRSQLGMVQIPREVVENFIEYVKGTLPPQDGD